MQARAVHWLIQRTGHQRSPGSVRSARSGGGDTRGWEVSGLSTRPRARRDLAPCHRRATPRRSPGAAPGRGQLRGVTRPRGGKMRPAPTLPPTPATMALAMSPPSRPAAPDRRSRPHARRRAAVREQDGKIARLWLGAEHVMTEHRFDRGPRGRESRLQLHVPMCSHVPRFPFPASVFSSSSTRFSSLRFASTAARSGARGARAASAAARRLLSYRSSCGSAHTPGPVTASMRRTPARSPVRA